MMTVSKEFRAMPLIIYYEWPHADSLGPDGRRTNLENLQALEALDFVEHGLSGEKELAQKREGEASVRPHDTSNVY